MKKPSLIFVLCCLINIYAYGQILPRSVSFGALVGDLDDSLKTSLKLPSLSGTIIKRVIEKSPASHTGFLVNDVLVAIDGKKIENTSHFLALLKLYKAGDNIKTDFYRQGRLKNASITFTPKPMEKSDDYEIIYSSVLSGKNHLRTIITKPKGTGIFPAVLIVGGVGCYSIDNIVNQKQSTKMWIDTLSSKGFVTIRVEKTGMGDSKGAACKECDFLTEKQGFLDGLKQLKALKYVDNKNVFIAGFSMGGLIAPLIAQEESVKGIIVYGTVGRNWIEYELENTHRQRLLESYPADSIDIWMRAEIKRLYGLFVEKKEPVQIIKDHPETAVTFFTYPMSIPYFQQIADINIRELWKKTNSNVLVMHGSSDFVSSKEEHQLIAEVVNQYNGNKAIFKEIVDSDHWEYLTRDAKESLSHTQTKFNPLAVNTAVDWMLHILKS